jgi:membrane associated rhomboid family serine protease
MSRYYQNSTSPGSFGGGIKDLFKGRNALSRLILANLVVFVLLGIVRLVSFLFHTETDVVVIEPLSTVAQWLAVPASLDTLLNRPWTIFTYMFLHEGILHILLNMVILYFAGRIFMEYLGGKKLFATYVIGGLMGGAFYIAAYNVFPVFRPIVDQSVALGASASVLAILVAIAVLIPNHSVTLLFAGRIKLKYIALIFVAIDLLSIEKSNPGGHIAHLGGAAWGLVYILLLKKGVPVKKWFSPLGRAFKKIRRPGPKLHATYSKRPLNDDEYSSMKADHQKKIDAILDKISKSGYESLSREEKELLFKSSKKEF